MTDPDQHQPESKKKGFLSWKSIGILFSAIGILVFICAFAYGYFKLSQVNLMLAQKTAHIEEQMVTLQNDLSTMQKTSDALKQREQEARDTQKEQEQMLTEWRSTQKGDLNAWQVAEAQYLVKLANDHLQFTNQYKMALVLLQRADQLLSKMSDPRLLKIRESLAKDIANLEVQKTLDVTTLFTRLTALNVQLDHLQLPLRPLKADHDELKTEAKGEASQASFWQSFWDRTLTSLGKIVIIRKEGPDALPLILPEEKIFLYQNLHAQIESAKWGLLNRDQGIYQMSLARAVVWIMQYFDGKAEDTQTVLQNLNELLKINIQPQALNLAETLQLFEGYFALSQRVKA